MMTIPDKRDSKSKSKVMLVEDHPVVLHGLANLIDDEPDLAVCGGASSIDEAMRMVRQVHPDVIIADISLGKESGLDLVKELHESLPDLPVLALSMHEESLYAERALRAGARGYVMKNEPMEDVMDAIRRVLAGEIVVSNRMATRMLNKFVDKPGRGRGAEANSALESLSDREFEIFNLIAQGIGPTEMAKKLDVSVKTVETHRERVKAKLGLKSGAELTRYAIEWAMKQR